jgi:hypothetical protein
MATQKKRASSAARRRVLNLLEATSKLHRGDLLAVLELDSFTPLTERNEPFEPTEAGWVGTRRAEELLRQRPRTGEELARILEGELESLLKFAQAALPTVQKRRRRGELGGRAFEW